MGDTFHMSIFFSARGPQALRSTMLALALVNVHGDAALRPDTAAEHHEAGVTYHLQRSLDEAAREYRPGAAARSAAHAAAGGLPAHAELGAARVRHGRRAMFGLKDAAAILHPGRRAIAYHLFWDDDIDFPDDNDPSDHEVVWIEYDAAGALARVVTLFHGRLVAGSSTALEARGHGGRPRIDVQWGKHGPMPAGWRQITVATEESDGDTGIPDGLTVSLEDYNARSWRKLSTEGTRGRDHPLAVRYGWPARFNGTLAAFTSFTREIDIRPLLEKRSMMLVSRWNSGSLARQLLFYNFRPKLEWPDM